MASLFNLTAELQELYSVLTAEADEHGEVKPDTDAIIATHLQSKETEIAVKLDNYIDLIRRLEGEAKMADIESNRYANLAVIRGNAVEQLKASLKLHLETIGASKVTTSTQRKVWLQSNGQAPLILAPDATVDSVPESFVRVVKSINTAAIREAIKAGEELEFAKFGDKGTHIRIS